MMDYVFNFIIFGCLFLTDYNYGSSQAPQAASDEINGVRSYKHLFKQSIRLATYDFNIRHFSKIPLQIS